MLRLIASLFALTLIALAAVDAVVRALLRCQKQDGRFGAGNLDFAGGEIGPKHMALLWGNGRLLVGLLEYHAACPSSDVLRAASRHPDQAMATVGALARMAAPAFDVRPLADTLATVLRSGDAERRARFICEGLAKIAALAALAEAKSDFATLYGDTRLSSAKGAPLSKMSSGMMPRPRMSMIFGLRDEVTSPLPCRQFYKRGAQLVRAALTNFNIQGYGVGEDALKNAALEFVNPDQKLVIKGICEFQAEERGQKLFLYTGLFEDSAGGVGVGMDEAAGAELGATEVAGDDDQRA